MGEAPMTMTQPPVTDGSTGAAVVRGHDAATAAPAVRVDHVSKRYTTGVLALDDVDLTVRAGEFLCLVGASGCGKSTLLNLIAGLDHATSGTIDVPGGRPTLLFQEAALLPWQTASGNVELALRLRGVGKKERRAK